MIEYVYFALEGLMPVAIAIIIFLLEKFTGFKKLNYWIKEVIIGVLFGGIAIIGTHYGVRVEGAVINARDAAVIPAGLIFGWPAGLIAGFIGGFERMIAGLVNPTSYGFTIIACSVSTFLAGTIAGLIKEFIFKDRRVTLISSLFIGFVIETFHLFMVFVTNANQYQKAFSVVKACSLPMLLANSLGVLFTLMIYYLLTYGKDAFKVPDRKSLNSKFTVTLACLTIFTFLWSSTFIYFFNDSVLQNQTRTTLTSSIEESLNEVNYKVVEKSYQIRDIMLDYEKPLDDIDFKALAITEGFTELNVADHNGVIRYSNVDINIGFYYGSKDATSKYMDLTKESGPDYIVENFRRNENYDRKGNDEAEEYLKYAGIKLEFSYQGHTEKGFVQFGFDKNGANGLVESVALFKHVGETGSLIIVDELDYSVISKGQNIEIDDSYDFESVIKSHNAGDQFNIWFKIKTVKNGETVYEAKECLARYEYEDTHFIFSVLPFDEANLSRDISTYINTFLEIIVFGLIFITVYMLVRKLVIERIEETNKSLKKITDGNLKIKVHGGTTTEFVSLAKGINSTVKALNGYIDAANRRIDEELAMAKAIQSAVLPSTFPAFPDRKEFDIYASMHAAKQVGGDLYDFYFSNTDTFHITIADVSGKGIPAALFMMRAKSILKSTTQTNIPINEVFYQSNNSLCTGNEAGMFVTAWSGSIKLKDGTFNFANGGHNPPVIKRANGKFEFLKSHPDFVLAGMPDANYVNNEIKLNPGDIIFLYTDGVTEGVNPKVEQFGEDRLIKALNAKEFKDCKELCDYVYEQCVKFADGAAQFDDITMLAFKYNGIENK